MSDKLYRWWLSFFYNVPIKINDVWYNRSAHIKSEKLYPEIYDENKNYIPISKDRLYVMQELSNGKKVYYKIYNRRYKHGDWLYDSDGYQVDFILHSIR